jgi:hypothetical protein
MTRSSTVRLTDAATAKDVVELVKKGADGCLVLVGALYNVAAVQFEHEVVSSEMEPFHICKTLLQSDNPLKVRDEMQQILELKQHQQRTVSSSSTIAPKLQWFFVPYLRQEQESSNHSSDGSVNNLMPWIELDGYSTTMEDEDFDAEEDDEDESDQMEPEYPDPFDEPWKKTGGGDSRHGDDSAESKDRIKQWRRYLQLSLQRTDPNCMVSGYLWKQSHADKNVWRKVHCVLTEDHFWFVTRIRAEGYAYHGRLDLHRALLVDKGRWGWQLVSAQGRAHLFRATTLNLQQQWKACLQERIFQSRDNILLEQAELIVADESEARAKRLKQYCSIGSNANLSQRQLSLQVVDYREQCRHIQRRLPSKTLVVSTMKSTASLTSLDASSSLEEEDLDADLQAMIRGAWDMAASILLKALKMKPGCRNMETLCRQADYAMTGRMRPLSEVGTPNQEEFVNKSRDAPPADLLDQIVEELEKAS